MLSPCRASSSCAAVSGRRCASCAVRQHHLLLAHVVDGLAVEHRARAAGVVGHHAADGGAAGRRHIRGEAQVERPQRGVQLVEHHARLHARPLLVGVDLENPVQVLRGVEHQAGANGLAGLRGAAAARRDGHAVAGRDVHRLRDRFGRARNDDAERLDLVDAGVGRVQRARDRDRIAPRRRWRLRVRAGGLPSVSFIGGSTGSCRARQSATRLRRDRRAARRCDRTG